MARSRKKTPVKGHTTAESEKDFKRHEHGVRRTREREVLAKLGTEVDPVDFPDEKEIGDPWDGPKDGKSYLDNPTRKDLAK